jgi:ABC-type transport system substrate-binding protein
LNVNRYCSEGVERLVREAERTVDREARAALYNRADRVYLEDVAVIPLYQKLSMLAWSSELSGPEPNFSISTDLWNVASWTGKSSIVVALPGEPTVIDPLSLTDDEANVVLSTLMYGAFGMDPTHSAVPLLVESVDVIEAGE